MSTPFVNRHIGPDAEQQQRMLELLGLASLDELTDRAMPAAIRDAELHLPPARSEAEILTRLRDLAARNFPGRAMIGLGYHGTVTPAVIRRNVLEDPAWYTAYTPYQPEISQGRLEMLLNFQTMVADLTGLPIAGASLLDEATAVAEAAAMARRLNRNGEIVLADPQLLPQSLAVLSTRMDSLGIEVAQGQSDLASDPNLARAFCVIVQTPAQDGRLQSTAELTAIADAAHEAGALVVAAADLLALTLVTPPGEWGADIAVGSTQRFGVPLFYGGPHAGYIAAREGTERQLPGRLVGLSVDADGVPALRLALQTREQHIRREKGDLEHLHRPRCCSRWSPPATPSTTVRTVCARSQPRSTPTRRGWPPVCSSRGVMHTSSTPCWSRWPTPPGRHGRARGGRPPAPGRCHPCRRRLGR